MKKYIFAINLLALLMLISSCEDIVDADQNIRKTKIEYKTVKTNQENSVIMPLKVGNLWVYKVTEFNEDGSTKSMWYDTTFVIKDTLVNGEKWFLTKDPNYSFNTDKICLTNTDVGLYVNDMNCFCFSLRAEYPAKHSSYLFSDEEERPVVVRNYSDDGKLIKQDTVNLISNIVIYVSKIQGYESSYGNYNCITYKSFLETLVDGKLANQIIPQISTEYYVPDLGLIRKEISTQYEGKAKIINVLTELISTNVKI